MESFLGKNSFSKKRFSDRLLTLRMKNLHVGEKMARVSIEDCQKVMPNRFALVVVAANRARQLMGSSPPLVSTRNKHGVTALREIAEGKVICKGTLTEFDELAGESSSLEVKILPPRDEA